MKKSVAIGFAGCLTAALFVAPAQAQETKLLVYVSKMRPAPASAASGAAPLSYKSHVGVYVRAKVMRTFLESFDGATDVLWHLDNHRYLASFKRGGRPCRALFDINGMLIYSMRTGTPKELPRDVYRLFKATYIDYTIGAVAEMETQGRKIWIANFEDAENLVVVQVTDGRLEELRRYKTHL